MSLDSRVPVFAARRLRPLRLVALLAGAAVLGGCASFSPDGGFGPVEQTAKERLGKDLRWARSEADLDTIAQRVSKLLAKPLTVDGAVQTALLSNRALQASFLELGITEAEVVQAGRVPNPGFSFGRSSRGDEREIERGLHFNLARLLVMPMVRRKEAQRFQQTQGRVAMRVLRQNTGAAVESVTVTLLNLERPSAWDEVSDWLDRHRSNANADLCRIARVNTL